jgi:hypothetical protein
MSVSMKNTPITKQSRKDSKSFLTKYERRDSSSEKPRKHISLKNIFYEIEPKQKFDKNLTILNYITNTQERKYSAKTALTNAPEDINDYDLGMINKYDENLNTSLSFISEFDLEQDKSKLDNSFNSCGNDENSIEQIEIKTRTNNIYNENEEFDFELEKEWNDIQDLLLNKDSSH